MTNRPPQRRQRIGALALTLFLGACGSAPDKNSGAGTAVTPVAPQPQQRQSWQLPPSEYSQQFATAESALLRFDWMAASAALETIPAAPRSATDDMYSAYLQARIAFQRGDSNATEAALTVADRSSDPALGNKVMNFQRHRRELNGEYLASAQLAEQLRQQARSPEAEAALRRLTWHNLQLLEREQIPTGDSSAASLWQGWLDLARASRADSLTQLTTQLRLWQSNHRTHPAADPLPGGMSYLLQDNPGPRKVVLLLPLSGRLAPAGRAVRDGYLASYYGARNAGDEGQEILIYDLQEFESATTAYQQAVSVGAELVVGPLSRQGVDELGGLSTRPIPVLTLNRTSQPANNVGSAMVQMSLDPEDEARQIAALAFGEGARRATLIRPAGEWGDKMDRALRERWSSLGGTLATTARYASQESYADAITQALSLDGSNQRARNVRTQLNMPIEFTARRRQDIDAVFLLAKSPGESRALMPLLSFYYAGNLPVYATSSVHRGIPAPTDKDLNGIRLVELPWLLGSNPSARVAIAAGDTGTDAYTRLNALGADAHRLQTLFQQLQAGPDASIRGDTGLLTMDPQLRILREARMATFDGGALKPL